MVHRIQNRNTGYSDFVTNGSAQSFNFSTPTTHGANALKLENEVVENTAQNNTSENSVNDLNKQYNEELLSAQETSVESIVENDQVSDYEQSFSEEVLREVEEQKISNGLENFGVEENAPDLFSSHNDAQESENLLSDESEDISDDDDLEIPAFLRRQKD